MSRFCWGGSGSVGAGGSFPKMGGFLEVSREQLLIARKAQLWLMSQEPVFRFLRRLVPSVLIMGFCVHVC